MLVNLLSCSVKAFDSKPRVRGFTVNDKKRTPTGRYELSDKRCRDRV